MRIAHVRVRNPLNERPGVAEVPVQVRQVATDMRVLVPDTATYHQLGGYAPSATKPDLGVNLAPIGSHQI